MSHLFKFIFLLSVFPTYLAFAQTDPCFDANAVKGCAPFTVNMTDCSGADASLIFYDYGEGPTTETSHTFDKVGVYSIKQLINSGSGGKELLKSNYIEVVEGLPIDVEIIVCEGRTVQVSIRDSYYDEYSINFGDGTIKTVSGLSNTTHVYADDTNKTINIGGFFSGTGISCALATKIIKPLEKIDIADFTTVELNSVSSAILNFTLSPAADYQVGQSINGSAFSVLETLSNTSTHTVLDLKTDSEISVFRITALSPCGGTLITSREINTTFLEVEAQSGVNKLHWTASLLANFDKFQIFRNEIEIASILQADSTLFLDSAVQCNEQYCYKIIAYADSLETQSISQTVCVRGQKEASLDSITYITASVNEQNQVVLSWELPDSTGGIQEIRILRVNTDSTTTDSVQLIIPSTESYLDTNSFAANSQYCYQVTYQDLCGNVAAANPMVCTIFLTGEQNGTEVSLNWTEYTFFSDTVSMDSTATDTTGNSNLIYFVQMLDDNGNVFSQELVDGLSFIDTNPLTTIYRIKACDPNNPDVCVYSNTYTIVLTSFVKIPTAFSPNGDGLNDTFGIVGRLIVEMEMEIYNIWGNPIFKESGTDVRWDGTMNGVDSPQATYSYYITAVDKRGRIYKKTGHIVLIK